MCIRDRDYILAFLLSDVAEKYAEILSASMTFEVGQIASLPIIYLSLIHI